MENREKCCSHCPGKWRWGSREGNKDADHVCSLPRYVSGNLRISSLSGAPDDPERCGERLRGKIGSQTKAENRPSSCIDRFAIAKKFHAENLQHQPLPDRVDDSVFKNLRFHENRGNFHEKIGNEEKDELDRSDWRRRAGGSRFFMKNRSQHFCGPSLGCKTPTTNMDLAICWEAPLDASYEPRRSVHIDGTDGGPAPAIFTLVEHEIPCEETHRSPGKCTKTALQTYEAKFSNVKNRLRCDDRNNDRNNDDHRYTTSANICQIGEDEITTEGEKTSGKIGENRRKSLDLCNGFDACRISNEDEADDCTVLRSPSRKIQPLHLRNCAPCECRGVRSARKTRGTRLVQSANTSATRNNVRRNGLPTKICVPRPKTPYAKRSFCIDTLTPPFSIVNGCRDADYPEHWRLTSVYQQSYRNPIKQRGTILTYS